MGKYRHIVDARSLLCYWAVREMGITISSLARKLNISVPAVSKSTIRGEELAGTENRIAVERRRYNETVKTYNVKIRTFPSNIMAGMFGFTKAEFFDVPESAKGVPEVKF